jgi:rhamnose utilization protein RhaD (predicted bifunctional aldolase and dehydrogenase)
MRRNTPPRAPIELQPLLELTGRVGADPLLTQASTGNSSMKLRGILWIKASGKWMADAGREDILIPLDLAEVQRCVREDIDPAERCGSASIETAMHAVLPHRVVVHVHCVNTIAWAVRQDAPVQLKARLRGLRWQWIPYAPSGMPLARDVENALREPAETDVLVLGNHGLVVGGEDCGAVEDLLFEVQRRLAIPARPAHPADYTALAGITEGSSQNLPDWDLPDDDAVHALATDAVSREILSRGLLYPCQAIFSGGSVSGGSLASASVAEPFRSIPYSDFDGPWERRYGDRCFLIIEGRGVILNRTMTQAERAMISGLAQVVQRIPDTAPLHYLTEAEIAGISSSVAYRYRELANAGKG